MEYTRKSTVRTPTQGSDQRRGALGGGCFMSARLPAEFGNRGRVLIAQAEVCPPLVYKVAGERLQGGGGSRGRGGTRR